VRLDYGEVERNKELGSKATFWKNSRNSMKMALPNWKDSRLTTADITQYLNWHVRNDGWLPPSLNPKVIWIIIGTNDHHHNCSTDASERVMTGIFEVMREVRKRKPSADIVV
jgi:hypothetical protein